MGVGERISFRQCDLLIFEQLSEYIDRGGLDAIVSNPPYIKSEVIPTLSPEVQCEPVIALDGGADGLDFYRRFLNEEYRLLVRRGGFMAFEIGFDQADDIKKLTDCRLYKDYGGNYRLAVVDIN